MKTKQCGHCWCVGIFTSMIHLIYFSGQGLVRATTEDHSHCWNSERTWVNINLPNEHSHLYINTDYIWTCLFVTGKNLASIVSDWRTWPCFKPMCIFYYQYLLWPCSIFHCRSYPEIVPLNAAGQHSKATHNCRDILFNATHTPATHIQLSLDLS